MQIFNETVRTLLERSVDMILPPRCVMTGEEVERQGMLAPSAWAELDFIAAPLCDSCGIPFGFEVEDKTQCADCLAHPPPFGRARAALVYNEGSRNLVLGFKYADKLHAVKAFTPWLKRAGAEVLAGADCLVPVPLHRWRLIGRRYNQAALIARDLSKETGIKTISDGLLRIRSTPPQGHLPAKERHKNVKSAFAVNPAHDFRGKTVVLVDDVYTTGATVSECALALKKSGAAQVHVLTLARVVKNGFA